MHKRLWKCQDCGISQQKEPHRTLSDHMESVHGKRWCDIDCRFAELLTWEVWRCGLNATHFCGMVAAVGKTSAEETAKLMYPCDHAAGERIEVELYEEPDADQYIPEGHYIREDLDGEWIVKKDDPKCPMCGIPFANHDGLTLMCRRYHRLRIELLLVKQSVLLLVDEMRAKTATFAASHQVDYLADQIDRALMLAETNQVQEPKSDPSIQSD